MMVFRPFRSCLRSELGLPHISIDRGVDIFHAPREFRCLVTAGVAPIQFVADEVVRHEQVVVDEQPFTDASTGYHRTNLTAERAAADKSDFFILKAVEDGICAPRFRLCRNDGRFGDFVCKYINARTVSP